MITIRWNLLAGFIGAIVFVSGTAGSQSLIYTEGERAFIESHGPWPPAPVADPSNKVATNADAIELGRRLFFTTELSIDNTMSCATCHDPTGNFIDGLQTGFGRARLPRNTPSLVNMQWARWFGRGGGADSLWSQSIRPLVAPDEMASNGQHIQQVIASNDALSCFYTKAFETPVGKQNPERTLVNAAKALAAFQATLVTHVTAFDEFRQALLTGDQARMSQYPIEAQRGLKLFTGKGQCSLCHFGPRFTNGEFGDVGIPFFLEKGKVDKGRYGGVQNLKKSPYALTGIYSDDVRGKSAVKTRHLVLQHRNWGEFQVPSLRSIAETAPYMHSGSLATLHDVVDHYSEIDEERLHVDGEKILKPLRLTSQESGDLVAFMRSLSAPLVEPLRLTDRGIRCTAR